MGIAGVLAQRLARLRRFYDTAGLSASCSEESEGVSTYYDPNLHICNIYISNCWTTKELLDTHKVGIVLVPAIYVFYKCNIRSHERTEREDNDPSEGVGGVGGPGWGWPKLKNDGY